MAIDPTTTTTVKVSELASAGYNTTDLIPHEVAGILKKGNLQDLATFIGGIISTEGAVGFRAVQVNDGETLPATDEQEFILVGPGTYPNVGGGPTITTTEPLNALVSNATYWFIGVEIPITATGVWGTITGVLSDQTDLNDVLDAKADLVDGKVPNSQLPSYVDDVVEVADFAALPATGETGKIYVTIDNGNVYRWSGSAYIRIADESPVWGIITGTLSDQTDLQDALDGKFDVPTGDTTQYIAGDGSLITFPVAGQAGTLVRLVRNNSGATITKGTVVYINGASGNNPTIAKAIATGDSTSAQTFGLVQSDITNNSNGYVVVTGDLIGANTSAIAEGSQLYLSSTTAGEYTTTKQLAPAHLVYIGVVTRSHATLGQIEVKIQNGYELDELHDVAISSKANNEVIVYESSTDLWKNKSIATILGYTPANDSSVVHIAGTETITGIKTFSVDTIFNGVTVGKGGASEAGNTAVGENALSSNTSGILNTAIGFESLLNNTGGGDNTSLGWWSLKSNTTGNSNVSAGTASLANNTTGFGNTSLGWNSLAVSTTGAFNSALGYLAGSSFGGSDSNANTLTSYSIYIGYKAGPLANSQTNQIVIGKNAIGAGSNTVTIGNTDITTTRLRGEIQGGSFKKDGGTSSQFLKADGSVDSTTYQTALTNPVTGTGTTNYIPKFTGASAIGNSLIYDNGTNVGIGTTSPLSKLHIEGDNSSTTDETVLTLRGNGENGKRIDFRNEFGSLARITGTKLAGGASADEGILIFETAINSVLSERMRITSGGNVGIGTESPGALLNVVGASDMSGTFETTGTNNAASLILKSGNGTTSGLYSYLRFINNNTNQQDWRIGTYGNNNFSFVNSKALSTPMILTTNGELLIGRTSSYGAGWQLAVEGNIYAKNDLRIDANASFGGSVGIGTTSPNINNYTRALTVLASSGYAGIEVYGGSTTAGAQIDFGGGTDRFASISGEYESATNGYLNIRTRRAGSMENAMRITSGGNVYVNATSGLYSAFGYAFGVKAASGNQTYLSIATPSQTLDSEGLVIGVNADDASIILRDNKPLDFWTNNTNRMRITSGGSVGIGTTSPDQKLTVEGNIRVGGVGNGFLLDTLGVNYTNGMKVVNNYETVMFSGRGSSGYVIAGDNNLRFGFGTNYSAGESMRITSGGNVLLGTTSGTGKMRIDADGSVQDILQLRTLYASTGSRLISFVNSGGSEIGSVMQSTGATVSYNVTSDYRLKEDLQQFKGLDLISKIKIYNYKWKGYDERSFGVLAHELQETIPSAVSGEKDGKNMQQVDYSKLVPILIQSIQELKQEIEILKNK